MKCSILIVIFSLTLTSVAKAQKIELLIIGDSQNGGFWSKDYFGNHLQECLSRASKSFAVYARGGTQFNHWLNDSALDHIETVYRDALTPQKLMGKEATLIHKRITSLIEFHNPERVAVFLGDNLISLQDNQIRLQVQRTLEVLQQSGVNYGQCIFITPTFEMQVSVKRNVPLKDYKNTLRINTIIKDTVSDNCLIIDGLDLMKTSSFLLKNQTLMRKGSRGLIGCGGAALNDNIHYCGEAAAEFATKVCEKI